MHRLFCNQSIQRFLDFFFHFIITIQQCFTTGNFTLLTQIITWFFRLQKNHKLYQYYIVHYYIVCKLRQIYTANISPDESCIHLSCSRYISKLMYMQSINMLQFDVTPKNLTTKYYKIYIFSCWKLLEIRQFENYNKTHSFLANKKNCQVQKIATTRLFLACQKKLFYQNSVLEQILKLRKNLKF
eukprot:TRINITY_DN6401_c0_g2_i1.p1 TRINITY_DN6401_c0_g2~~TRINITY_DN6401_c0_g2_i1.p1  ORF type:complete len:185 (-),score=-21.17 TRINITY_DN6401_c0_g2_i1:220-774(-)